MKNKINPCTLFLITLASSGLSLGIINERASAIDLDSSLRNSEISMGTIDIDFQYNNRNKNFYSGKYSQIIAQSSIKAIVFAPPSNIRTSPDGEIICSVRSQTNINVFGYENGWYETNHCGWGYIHESQIKFSQNTQSTTLCKVKNIQTGILTLRDYPNGNWEFGLNNGDIVRQFRKDGIWSYVRVQDTPNNRLIGLEGWVNSNYLGCL